MDWREGKGNNAGGNLHDSSLLHLLSIPLVLHSDEETRPQQPMGPKSHKLPRHGKERSIQSHSLGTYVVTYPSHEAAES